MWVLIQEPKGGILSCPSLDWTENHCLAGGTIKSYECGLARWALPPGSRLVVGREGADIEVCSCDIIKQVEFRFQGVVKDVNVSKRHATITVGEHVQGGKPEVGCL